MLILNRIGALGYLLYRIATNFRFGFRDRKRIIDQLNHVGVNSLPIVLLTGFFAGAIIAWQAAYQFRGMVSLSVLGGQAMRVIVMEMGPVLTALVIAGRIGASMTAEIGTMKVTEQIDALRTLSIDPIRYIVLPRFVSLSIMMPVLTIFSNMMGLLGAFFVSDYFLDITSPAFFESVKDYFMPADLFGGLLKASFFGILIATIGCFMGIHAHGGAQGVGRATITSFVTSSILILVGDFALWLILF